MFGHYEQATAGGSSVIPINYQVDPFSYTTLDGTTVTVTHDFKVLNSEPVTLTVFMVPFSLAIQIPVVPIY